uniref:Uncharacterized protein n=1 Tax=Anopheles darlingi TaxID=43151 RepID=A0A2M4DLG1_ANODA
MLVLLMLVLLLLVLLLMLVQVLLLLVMLMLLSVIVSSRWSRIVVLIHVISFAMISWRSGWSRIVLSLGTKQLIVDARRLEAIQVLQTHPHVLVQHFHRHLLLLQDTVVQLALRCMSGRALGESDEGVEIRRYLNGFNIAVPAACLKQIFLARV